MKYTHTPGPWAAWPANSASCRHPAIMADVGQVASATWQGSERATNANARLIAAAPDMLKALREADEDFAREGFGEESPYRTEIRAAIAKATGQEGGAL